MLGARVRSSTSSSSPVSLPGRDIACSKVRSRNSSSLSSPAAPGSNCACPRQELLVGPEQLAQEEQEPDDDGGVAADSDPGEQRQAASLAIEHRRLEVDAQQAPRPARAQRAGRRRPPRARRRWDPTARLSRTRWRRRAAPERRPRAVRRPPPARGRRWWRARHGWPAAPPPAAPRSTGCRRRCDPRRCGPPAGPRRAAR